MRCAVPCPVLCLPITTNQAVHRSGHDDHPMIVALQGIKSGHCHLGHPSFYQLSFCLNLVRTTLAQQERRDPDSGFSFLQLLLTLFFHPPSFSTTLVCTIHTPSRALGSPTFLLSISALLNPGAQSPMSHDRTPNSSNRPTLPGLRELFPDRAHSPRLFRYFK